MPIFVQLKELDGGGIFKPLFSLAHRGLRCFLCAPTLFFCDSLVTAQLQPCYSPATALLALLQHCYSCWPTPYFERIRRIAKEFQGPRTGRSCL